MSLYFGRSMIMKSPEAIRLREMARHFRECADQTCYPDYFQMMIRTAEELNALAAKFEGTSDPEPHSKALDAA